LNTVGVEMAIMEISVIPMGTETPSISEYVTEAIKVLEKEGVKYEITAMGTLVEGELEKLLELAARMHQAVIDKGALRVVTTIKLDDRRDKPLSIEGKVKSVREKLA
jgi:uncharacterized protein (TIGR00106 family)